jgi:hypothetical protein
VQLLQCCKHRKQRLPGALPYRINSWFNYGGQCMSFASMKLIDTADGRRLGMTVLYRNHFYIEKLLGNLVGLGRLMGFIAGESGIGIGALTVVSTHALIDQPRSATRRDIQNLLLACDQAVADISEAA